MSENSDYNMECRLYFRECLSIIVLETAEKPFDFFPIYNSLFRKVSPRPDTKQCWLALTGGVFDIDEMLGKEQTDYDGAYELMERFLSVCSIVATEAENGIPHWPDCPSSAVDTISWLEGICSVLGLASYAQAVLAGVPEKDLFAASS